MKALILSCNTGSGHNTCAAAVAEALAARGIPCDIRDGLSFVSKGISRFISSWHVRLYRSLPRLYGWGYSLAERQAQSAHGESLMFRFLGLGAGRLRAFIAQGGYTHVLCTHLFPAQMLTGLQRKDPLDIRIGFISTDYTASPGYESIDADWCFIPTPELAPEFVRPGMPPERVVGCGIPVGRAFQAPGDRRAARQALGLRQDCRHLLVMSGSMGCGPLKRVLKQLSEVLGENVEISVVCGSNRRLYRQLSRRMGSQKNIHIHQVVERISTYMDSADLYLTKPGGLSVSEGMSKKLPMALLKTVEGCETYNMRYCLRRGAAIDAGGVDDVAGRCADLISDDGALAKMRAHMDGLFEPPAAEVVCDCLFTVGDET